MTTNEEIIEENAMKLTRDWDSFKQTKVHLTYMLNKARADEREKAYKERKKIFNELDSIEMTVSILGMGKFAKTTLKESKDYQALKSKYLKGETNAKQ